ncbi:MAG TPA: DUF547 domain-containing protein, partial [Myxococcaceae bacterium]|nr:DUF547 domain-containing protein [Myxococcaceae bacterium]
VGSPGAVLNPPPGEAGRSPDAVELSRALLHESRRLDEGPSVVERLALLAGQLWGVDPMAIAGDDARLAFWLNVYNALTRHALVARRVRGNLLLHLRLFSRAAYAVGGQRYSLNLIEHGLLRGNQTVPPLPFRAAKTGDPRLAAAPRRLEPRIHFALNCGARSCPPIRSYEPGRLGDQLELATRAYVEAETRVDRAARAVVLPYPLRLYRKDFGATELDVVRFAARHLPAPDGPWLEEHAERVRVRYGRYDWTVLPPQDRP